MIKLLIIADDFTGALDTGVQFAKKGIPTFVGVNQELDLEFIDKKIQVLAIDIESRHIQPDQAFKRVEKIVKKAKAYGIEYIYKKTDSTLRGNIGSELTALVKAAGSQELMFIPAFPNNNRVTIDGYHYVNEIPLDQTIFAQDPFEPVKHSYIPDIIKEQTQINVVVTNYKNFEFIDSDNEKVDTIYIFDAKDNSDLKEIGIVLKRKDKLKVMAGCAGFAEILSELLELEAKNIHFKKNSIGTLVISGSINEVSINQMNYAQKHGYESITLTPEQKLQEDYLDTHEGEKLLERIVERISINEDFIIKAVENRDQMHETDEYANKLNIAMNKVHLKIAENMGRLVKKILDKKHVGTLVVFGGDTVLGIMKAIKCYGIIPREEVVPGVVVSDVISDDYKLNIITKAGGFGNEDILIQIKNYLKKGE